MIRFTKILFAISFIIVLTFGCHSQISKTEREKSFYLARQSDTLLKENKLDSAEILIDKALKIYPGNYIAYNNRAYIKIQQKKPQQEIINDYKKAIEVGPEYDIGLYSLANYYFLIYDYENTINISSNRGRSGSYSVLDREQGTPSQAKIFQSLFNTS